MTYNLYFGGVDRVGAIYEVIAAAAPEVIALTEADDSDVVAELARRLDMEQVWARGSGDRHIALLSRFPITRWRIYNRPPLTQAVLETWIDYPLPLTLYSVHFLPYLLLPFEIRRWQAVGALLQLIGRDRPGLHLILGDFNAIAPGDRVLQRKNPPRMRRVMALQGNVIFRLAIPRLLKAGYVDCFRSCHPPLPRRKKSAGGEGATREGVGKDGFTWHTGNRTTRYDYIFADAAFAARLRDCRVFDDIPAVEYASDHYPVLADFDLTSTL